MTSDVKLVRASLAEQIREHLLSQIISGGLQPGDRLIELKIAAEMQTSQAPVREAIRELEAAGVVETSRNRGARVRVVDRTEQRDMYAVRAQLEGFAAELTATNGARIAGSLRQFIKVMRDAAVAGDGTAFANANTAFHRTIIEAAENRTLLDMWERLQIHIRTTINVADRSADLRKVAASHKPIVDAIEARDPAAARAAAVKHVDDNMPPPGE